MSNRRTFSISKMFFWVFCISIALGLITQLVELFQFNFQVTLATSAYLLCYALVFLVVAMTIRFIRRRRNPTYDRAKFEELILAEKKSRLAKS